MARWAVVLFTLILAVYTIASPVAFAEGTGGNHPPVESGEDTLGTPPPSVQPDELGLFELLGLYLEVIF